MAEYIVNKASYPGLFVITQVIDIQNTGKPETTSKELLENSKKNIQERIEEYNKEIAEIDLKLEGIAKIK